MMDKVKIELCICNDSCICCDIPISMSTTSRFIPPRCSSINSSTNRPTLRSDLPQHLLAQATPLIPCPLVSQCKFISLIFMFASIAKYVLVGLGQCVRIERADTGTVRAVETARIEIFIPQAQEIGGLAVWLSAFFNCWEPGSIYIEYRLPSVFFK